MPDAIRFWNDVALEANRLSTPRAARASPGCPGVGHDGRLVTGGRDGTVRVYDAMQRRPGR